MSKVKTGEPISYQIAEKKQVTHDTAAFHFKLAENASLDFLPGDHMHLHFNFDGEEITRPYTPSSTPDDVGFFEMIIKRYQSGIASSYMHNLKVGEAAQFSGPSIGGHLAEGMARHVGMVVGGAGITPMISIIRTALRRKWDVEIRLLYANKSEQDIILRDEFERYGNEHGNFKYLFALDQPPPDWSGHSGFLDERVMADFLPSPAPETLIFLCGPPMMEFKLREKLLSLGYNRKQIVIP